MADILPPAPIGALFTDYTWGDWYTKVRTAINQASVVAWTSINFTGSNLTSLVTRNHNDLQNFQGGTTAQYYHLTSLQQAAVAAGITATITTAKLTTGGTNGSMTFTRGILTAQVPAT